MTISNVANKLTFKEYLDYNDGTDSRYEFVDGELVLMNPPRGRHALIIRLINKIIESEIERQSLSWVTLNDIGVRTSIQRSRIPDLSIVTREQMEQYLDISAVLETPPILVIEVVSPESINRDYRFKRCSAVLGGSPMSDCIKRRSEYAAIGISEYWIVDPAAQQVTLLQLVEGFYEEKCYANNDLIVSPTFPELSITVAELWNI